MNEVVQLTPEVRDLVTFSLTRLLDPKGEATEWNEAIEEAIRTVERLP